MTSSEPTATVRLNRAYWAYPQSARETVSGSGVGGRPAGEQLVDERDQELGGEDAAGFRKRAERGLPGPEFLLNAAEFRRRLQPAHGLHGGVEKA